MENETAENSAIASGDWEETTLGCSKRNQPHKRSNL